uniref:Glycosyltransferase, GT2 family n=1 Tax=Candidatus Kentrum sp. FW TaxID=2126338 RepID=A0A450TK33_9GAMM|nr:MAG: Glycosyltransferase, GT2 family [Candidatus Kentron sp. FW]
MAKFYREIKVIEESGLFDRLWYLAEYPDVKETGMDPVRHYLWVGAALLRNPGPKFDTNAYLQANPGVRDARINPLLHYLMGGAGNGITGAVQAARIDTRVREENAPPPEAPPAFCVAIPEEAIVGKAKQLAFPPLPEGRTPDVSILIPCLDEIRYTLECLFSIRNALRSGAVTYEVMMFDNGSTDATPDLLPRIPNLVYLREEENIGFGPANNKAAGAARGEHVMFLNNDAQIAPGALEALLAAIRSDEGIGVVGPKVLGFDGRLQEAGSRLNADGVPAFIGFGQDHRVPRFNYQREVEYVSGAALLMERERFLALGGFDPIYAPAYYEDTDLCFRLRAEGLKIHYVPEAVVVHHLSVTSGKGKQDRSRSALLARNRQKFLQRWRGQLRALEINSISAMLL